jgi:hypothetical protein
VSVAKEQSRLARRRAYGLVLSIGLSAMLASVTLVSGGCTADPPRVVYDDVVDFWVTPAMASEPGYPFYHLGERPYVLVEQYNQASGHSFDHNSPVMLRAGIVLKDGTTIRLEFSEEWPEDCVLVYVDPPGKSPQPLGSGQPAVPQGETPYEAKAPALAITVFNTVGQHLHPDILGPWLWPRL